MNPQTSVTAYTSVLKLLHKTAPLIHVLMPLKAIKILCPLIIIIIIIITDYSIL